MANCPKIVISFDFELGWGVLDSELWKLRESQSLYKNLRPVLNTLFAVLKDTQISTTWAMVSSLLASLEKDVDVEHLPSSYRSSVIDFYRNSKESTRCGLDLVDSLATIDSLIEIASHTSTHIYAEQEDVTSSQYVLDVANSINDLEGYFNRKVSTLVFPRDQAKFNMDVAKKYPLNFRLNPSFGIKTTRLSRIVSGASRVYSMPPRSQVLMGASGEYYQTGSLYFNWSGGRYEGAKKVLTKLQSSRLLSSMEDSSIYHIWLHPFNLAESKEHLETFIKFIKALAALRDRGEVEVVTMDGVTKNCKNRFSFNE